MKDYQNSNQKELKKISSVKQLLSSYLVSKALVEIRQERVSEINSIANSLKPKLITNDEKIISLFDRFSKLINYKEVLMGIAKIGLDDLDNYRFEEDPSINKAAAQDTKHLTNQFGSSFGLLENINLKAHTLRVFENALDEGEKKGRSIDIALPLLGALFHDFGKSSRIREELLGSEVGKSYRTHASVSKTYIDEKIRIIYPNSDKTISLIEYLVDNHHPSNNSAKNNEHIAFINRADIGARKEELKILKEKMQ
jgi:hypothetical protein